MHEKRIIKFVSFFCSLCFRLFLLLLLLLLVVLIIWFDLVCVCICLSAPPRLPPQYTDSAHFAFNMIGHDLNSSQSICVALNHRQTQIAFCRFSVRYRSVHGKAVRAAAAESSQKAHLNLTFLFCVVFFCWWLMVHEIRQLSFAWINSFMLRTSRRKTQ